LAQLGIRKEAKCITRRSFLLLISQTHEAESGLVRATNNMWQIQPSYYTYCALI